MKIFIVEDGRALWEDEYNTLIEETISDRIAQVADKLTAMEALIEWIDNYTMRAYDPDITYYRFEIEPEKSALLNQLWKYAKEHVSVHGLISIENYGGSSGSMVTPCAVVHCYNKDIDALSQLVPILRLGLPDLKANLAAFYSRERVERDIAAQVLELTDR